MILASQGMTHHSGAHSARGIDCSCLGLSKHLQTAAPSSLHCHMPGRKSRGPPGHHCQWLCPLPNLCLLQGNQHTVTNLGLPGSTEASPSLVQKFSAWLIQDCGSGVKGGVKTFILKVLSDRYQSICEFLISKALNRPGMDFEPLLMQMLTGALQSVKGKVL